MSEHRTKNRTDRRRAPSPGNDGLGEEGFALVLSILTLLALTVLAAGGFLLVGTEGDIAHNHLTSLGAFYAADAGHSHFMAENGVPQPTQTFVYGQDTSTVASRLLVHLETGMSVYGVESRGLRPEPKGGFGRRTVGATAVYTPFPMNVIGAFVAANGLRKNGVSGSIDGNDQAPPGRCPYGVLNGNQPPTAGATVPTGGYVQSGGGGGQLVPDGDPPVDETNPNPSAVGQATGIDWAALVNETKVTPHVRHPADPWPDFSSLPASEWPVIHVTSPHMDIGPAHSGRGVIILDGDLSFHGNFRWDGIILAGGRLVSDGNQTIKGTIMTGLNTLLGQNVGQASAVGNGQKSFLYHSCNVEAAARSMGWLAEVPGTWYETL